MSLTPEIPILDVSAVVNGDDAGIDRLADQLGAACRDIGFFYVAGHGLPPVLVERTFAMSKAFFALPLETKLAVDMRNSPHNRGYMPFEGETLDPSKPGDLKETFNLGLELAADDPEVLAGMPFRGVNQWPDLPGFRAAMLDYFDAIWALGRKLHYAICRDLGLDDMFFDDKLDRPLAILRLLHYPGNSVPKHDEQIGAGAHTDYGNITLLLPDATPGLEVRTRHGDWIDAPSVPGAFVCNIGDCLMRWTNDVYVSTPHRVRIPERKRYSIAFFLDPDPDADVTVLPGCVSDERPARYPPTTGAAYLKERLDATQAFRRDS
ncbi:MAG: 2-oxoglutarate and iron-dependent oxygenase domain-containing protein [Alphaproteobacteria bacterium]|jgi:isopenicillin N synthase-like dioxygenase